MNFFLLDSIRIASSLHYVQRELIIIVLTIVSRSRQYQFFVLQFFFHCDSISTTLNGIKFLLFYVKVVLNFGQSINGMIIMIIVFLSFAYYTQLEFKFNFAPCRLSLCILIILIPWLLWARTTQSSSKLKC